jgi:multidrug efflux pump
MNLSRLFIHRPVATTLLTLAWRWRGAGVPLLPVAPLPQVDFPTISVRRRCPAPARRPWPATVATPLERSLGASPASPR